MKFELWFEQNSNYGLHFVQCRDAGHDLHRSNDRARHRACKPALQGRCRDRHAAGRQEHAAQAHGRESRAYVTLDDRIPLDLALAAGEVFLKQYPPPLWIDEIQRAPGLCLEIKSWVDRFPTCSSRRPRGHSSTVEPFRRRKASRRTDRFEKS